MYAGGLAALAREQWHNVAAVTTVPILDGNGNDIAGPAVFRGAVAAVVERDLARTLPDMKAQQTPMSDWLFKLLREPLRQLIRIEQDYEDAFDRFELLVAMTFAAPPARGWVPPGRFMWKDAKARQFKQRTTADKLRVDVNNVAKRWGAIDAGIFRDGAEALAALDLVESATIQSHWY